MPDVKWTDAQKDAINARAGSVLVSAAAGSGKTAVLVQRIIDSITDKENPVSIDRMLIVTFTRAASAEMRSRIEAALNKLLLDDPYNKYLLRQKQLLYSAMISTIDGFCTEFVRRYFYKLGIQSDFRIADDGELNILRSKALDNTLEKFYNENSDDFKELVNSTCTYRNDDNLRNHIVNTYNFLTSIPFMDNWMDKMLSLYDDIPFEKTPYFDYVVKYSEECVFYCDKLLSTAFMYLEKDEILKPEQLTKLSDTLKADAMVFDGILKALNSGDWNNIKNAVDNAAFGRFPSFRGASDDNYKEIIKNLRNNYKDEIKKLGALFNKDIDSINTITKELYPIIKVFFTCVKEFRAEFSALKAEKNILDFADIETLMVNLLCECKNGEYVYTDISEEISSMFDAVLVDEFQDINEVQDLLFRAVTHNKNNLFVVGDVKQSIYGFRQAKPEIFINYKNKYTGYNAEDDNYPAKIILDRNFRSRLGITEACNFIFSTLMSADVGGLEYTDEEKLVCGAAYPENNSPNMELMLINSSEIDVENNETELSLEAKKVAEKIYKLIFEEKLQVKDGDSTRTATYGDIAILLRSPRGETLRAVTFVNELIKSGIPTISQEKNSFFDAPEIKLMLNFLSIIDNPVQDIPLLSVLMSPMFSFTSGDIAKLRISDRKSPLYIALKNSDDKKCVKFIGLLDKLRTLCVTTTVDRLIGIILNLTGFDCVAMAGERFNVNNIYLLQSYARSYAENGYKTLTAFMNYINRMKDKGTILNSVNDINDSSRNAVKVMSIHASKGLEFPICFISSTSTEFNLRDTTYDLVLNSENGIGFRIKKDILKFDTPQRKILSLMQKDMMISEEMRILYVALTRAKERLIITSVNKDPQKYLTNLESKIASYPISSYAVKNMSSYSDWLFTCALTNPSCNIRINNEPDYTYYKEEYKPWRVTIVDNEETEDIVHDEISAENSVAEEAEINSEFLEQFKSRIEFKYKNAPLSSLPQKISASDFAHRDNKIFNKILKKPNFMSESDITAAEKGTAFHNFMERCDLVKAIDNCEAEAERLCENGFLTERQVKILNYKDLEKFLSGKLIDRVLKAESYMREYQFTVKIDASVYEPELNDTFNDKKIVMQGAVDLVFIENGEAVVVDYKTDRVKDMSELASLYRKQVELYKAAIEECTDYKVKGIIIYSVRLNEEIIL